MLKLICISGWLLAMGTGFAQPLVLNKVLVLQMPAETEEVLPGYNGASVCWHPVARRYFAGFAGNARYPLAVFDEKGTLLSSNVLTTQADIRGLWYIPAKKQVGGNIFNDGGWFSYLLNSKGMPDGLEILHKGMHQPDENSAGALDPVKQQIFFLDNGQVVYYDLKTGNRLHTIALHLGRPLVLGADPNENPENEPLHYNITSVGYSGIATAPIAALNARENRIELYDDKQGFLRQILLLPEDANPSRRYNFACSNHIFWVFDPDKRCWTGYR